MNYFLLNYLRF